MGADATGKNANVNYSDLVTFCTYIPQVFSKEFAYPLIAVDTSKIDDTLYDWQSDKPFSYYDITIDFKEVVSRVGEYDASKTYFSIVKHWPSDNSDDESRSQNL